MIDAEKQTEFVALYEAHFGPWPAANPGNSPIKARQQEIWWDWLRTIPDDRLKQLVKDFANGWQRGNRKPYLDDLKKFWRDIRPVYDGPPKEVCQLCGGYGLIAVPCNVKYVNRRAVFHFEPEAGVLCDTAFPCKCSCGDRWARELGVAAQLREDVYVLFRDYRIAAGHKRETEPISLSEFLDGDVNATAAPNAIMWEQRLESRMRAGQFSEERAYRLPNVAGRVSQFDIRDRMRESLRNNATVAMLRKRKSQQAAGEQLGVAEVIDTSFDFGHENVERNINTQKRRESASVCASGSRVSSHRSTTSTQPHGSSEKISAVHESSGEREPKKSRYGYDNDEIPF